MIRGTCAALALLLAIPSIAGAQRADTKAGAKTGAADKKTVADKKTGAAEKKSADASAPKKPATTRRKSKESETPGISPAARSLARRTKSVFIFAAESCAREGNRCDPALRNDAELRFLSACGACNTAVHCEAERDEVLAGKARASKDPCAP
jgi:hypothetical protein